jgi:hypothetical protein
VLSEKCPFGKKRIMGDGRQHCDSNGVISDDPRKNDSAANRAYDEMRRKKG